MRSWKWHTGTLVTPSGTYQLALEQKQEAVRFFVPSVFLLEFRPPDEAANQ
jgi:hypothetical protein